MSTTEVPTLAADRYVFAKLEPALQESIARRAVSLYDGTRTRGRCWKIAMAEYRLSQPMPGILDKAEYGRVECSCGWHADSYSRRGLTTSARAHHRFHSNQRQADRQIVEVS